MWYAVSFIAGGIFGIVIMALMVTASKPISTWKAKMIPQSVSGAGIELQKFREGDLYVRAADGSTGSKR